jgi:hypothetical protein
MNIANRTIEEVTYQLIDRFDSTEIIKIILRCDSEIAEYPFTFSVIKSLIHYAKEEDGFSQKQIQKLINEAKLVEL